MWSSILSIFSTIKALIDLWKYWKDFQNSQRIKEAEIKRQGLDKALEAAKAAQTPEEAYDAQDRIVDNSD